MADWRDYWDPKGEQVNEEGLPTDPTDPQFSDRKRLAYQGFDWQTEAELRRQRQEWQARLLRENPEDMGLGVQNPESSYFKSPGERQQEFEDFMEEYEKELGVFNR